MWFIKKFNLKFHGFFPSTNVATNVRPKATVAEAVRFIFFGFYLPLVPSGTGDHEILSKQHDVNELCERSIAVEARTKELSQKTQIVELTFTRFSCLNKKVGLVKLKCFDDYEVRFCCDGPGYIIVKKMHILFFSYFAYI